MKYKKLFLASAITIVSISLAASYGTLTTLKDIFARPVLADTEHDEDHEHSVRESGQHDHLEHEEEISGRHEEHGGHEDLVHLSPEEIREFGIEIATASPGTMDHVIALPGEIVLNADRIAHVVPRVSGIARKVFKSAGENVKQGELLAIIESRELAEARAAFLAAIERERIAEANFSREHRLWKKKITSEQEYLNARQALSEARISRNSVEQQLHAIGLTEDDIHTMTRRHDASATQFEIRAPISGTIIERHLTLGESVAADTNVFTIADLSTVWVDLNIYQKDLAHIHSGQTVTIQAGHGLPDVTGTISWVSPQINEATRTAKARIVLPNPEGRLRPGLFVTARVTVGSEEGEIVVPKDAIQTFEAKSVIFILTPEGFKPVPVEVGRISSGRAEILSGIKAGQKYAAGNAFTLKAQLSKGAFGDGHNH